jgi:hypothetical protein
MAAIAVLTAGSILAVTEKNAPARRTAWQVAALTPPKAAHPAGGHVSARPVEW